MPKLLTGNARIEAVGRAPFAAKRVCCASRLRWPGEAAGSASSLTTNNKQSNHTRSFSFRESYFSTSTSEHKQNLDTPVLPRIVCCHETSAIGLYHAGYHLLQLGRLKLDYYGRLSAHH